MFAQLYLQREVKFVLYYDVFSFVYFQLGTHIRAKKKREEMSQVLQKLRKAAK